MYHWGSPVVSPVLEGSILSPWTRSEVCKEWTKSGVSDSSNSSLPWGFYEIRPCKETSPQRKKTSGRVWFIGIELWGDRSRPGSLRDTQKGPRIRTVLVNNCIIKHNKNGNVFLVLFSLNKNKILKIFRGRSWTSRKSPTLFILHTPRKESTVAGERVEYGITEETTGVP